MSKGKYSKKRGFSIRPIVLLLTVALLIGGTIGGTIAWLTATTQDVTNTFTVGDVAITLKETQITVKTDGTETKGEKTEGVTNTYPMIPGNTYTKDPTVEVVATSEDCYLFVKFEEINNPSTYLEYTSNLTTANDWTQGDGTNIPSNVWYRTVNKADSQKSWDLLDGNKIKVQTSVTKADLAAFDTNKDGTVSGDEVNGLPKLLYTAYAVQQDNLSVIEAWTEVAPKTTTGGTN